MANIKISELTALTPPDAADLVPVTDSSASQTKRTTVGEIVGIINGDVDVADDGTATISELPVSKLQDGSARQLLQTDAAGTGVEWTSNVDVPGTLDVTGATTLDSTLDVDGQSTLASAAVSDLTSGRVVLAGTSGELEDSAGLTFNGTQLDVDGNVVITGDLTVEGASTILETETVKVEDKNIELGVVTSPTDATADGGGITLKGTTDKTINWVDATDAWTFSEHVDIASAKEFRIAGTKVLDATSLGSAVVNSSLTSVGTITEGTWEGTAIDGSYVTANFGSQNATVGTLLAGAGARIGKICASDGSNPLSVDSNSSYNEIQSYNRPLLLNRQGNNIGIGTASATTLVTLADGGHITVGTTTGTKIGTAATQKLGFFNATPVIQPAAIANITTTATTGSLPAADGSVTIADAAAPTVNELLEYCVELETKLEATLTALRTLGVIAT